MSHHARAVVFRENELAVLRQVDFLRREGRSFADNVVLLIDAAVGDETTANVIRAIGAPWLKPPRREEDEAVTSAAVERLPLSNVLRNVARSFGGIVAQPVPRGKVRTVVVGHGGVSIFDLPVPQVTIVGQA